MSRPHILLADEPTGALDSRTSVEVMALLQELGREGLTVVLVTHELESVYAIVDQCILLDRDAQGIIARGAPKELRNSDDPRVRNFFQRKPRDTKRAETEAR